MGLIAHVTVSSYKKIEPAQEFSHPDSASIGRSSFLPRLLAAMSPSRSTLLASLLFLGSSAVQAALLTDPTSILDKTYDFIVVGGRIKSFLKI